MRIILETKRLVFREFSLSDAPILLDLNSDPEVIRYVGEPALADLSAAEAILHDRIFPQYEWHNMGRWAALLKDTDECIGWCGIKFLEDTREYDLGYRFFQKHWGQGYATEAAAAALAYGHRELKLQKIVAHARVENKRSNRVLEKIGMKFEKFGSEPEGEVAFYSSVVR